MTLSSGTDPPAIVANVENELYGVKWRNWKMMFKEVSAVAGEPTRIYGFPLLYNLHLDPKEEQPVLHAPDNLWVRYPAGDVLVEHATSLEQEPPIPPGTPDPYLPGR